MDEDHKIIVCITYQHGLWNPRVVAEGSVQKRCSECGQSVWLSISGQKMQEASPDAILLCETCLKAKLADVPEDEKVTVGLVPGAFEEALKEIKRRKE